MTEHVERIAVLEAEVRELKKEQDKVLECVQNIHSEMIRYKGFLGGIAFIASGVLIAITLAKDWIIKNL
jgi:ABC-type uncharacterized transport system fused permease/ATPase subunit